MEVKNITRAQLEGRNVWDFRALWKRPDGELDASRGATTASRQPWASNLSGPLQNGVITQVIGLV